MLQRTAVAGKNVSGKAGNAQIEKKKDYPVHKKLDSVIVETSRRITAVLLQHVIAYAEV
jgi:hypothetical protein